MPGLSCSVCPQVTALQSSSLCFLICSVSSVCRVGNAEGLGVKRREELRAACRVLSVSAYCHLREHLHNVAKLDICGTRWVQMTWRWLTTLISRHALFKEAPPFHSSVPHFQSLADLVPAQDGKGVHWDPFLISALVGRAVARFAAAAARSYRAPATCNKHHYSLEWLILGSQHTLSCSSTATAQVITFDMRGISGHPNHVAACQGVRCDSLAAPDSTLA